MADHVTCDGCGKIGVRRRWTICPEGWFYLEATNEDNPSDIVIVWACSEACQRRQWRPGPGNLREIHDPRLKAVCPQCDGPVTDEVMLVGHHLPNCPNNVFPWRKQSVDTLLNKPPPLGPTTPHQGPRSDDE